MTRYVYHKKNLRCKILYNGSDFAFVIQSRKWFYWTSVRCSWIGENDFCVMYGQLRNIVRCRETNRGTIGEPLSLLATAEKMIKEYLSDQEDEQAKLDALNNL